MLTKIDTSIKYGKQHGGFGIQILYPGLIRLSLKDTGFATLGRIDHARMGTSLCLLQYSYARYDGNYFR